MANRLNPLSKIILTAAGVLLVLAIIITALFIWLSKKPAIENPLAILYTQEAFQDQEVPGVKITEQEEGKIIRNEAEGYTIEMPLNLLIARTLESSALYFFLPEENGDICEDPECTPLMVIKATSKPENLSLEEWTKQEEKRAGYPMFEQKAELLINGQQAFRIEEETPRTAPVAYYFLAATSKVYQISIGAGLESAYRIYIETFKYK